MTNQTYKRPNTVKYRYVEPRHFTRPDTPDTSAPADSGYHPTHGFQFPSFRSHNMLDTGAAKNKIRPGTDAWYKRWEDKGHSEYVAGGGGSSLLNLNYPHLWHMLHSDSKDTNQLFGLWEHVIRDLMHTPHGLHASSIFGSGGKFGVKNATLSWELRPDMKLIDLNMTGYRAHTRWNKIVGEYIDVNDLRIAKSEAQRGKAVTSWMPMGRRSHAGCVQGIYFSRARGGSIPVVTMHSRVSAFAKIGPFDINLLAMLCRELFPKAEVIQMNWNIASLQIYSLEALPILWLLGHLPESEADALTPQERSIRAAYEMTVAYYDQCRDITFGRQYHSWSRLHKLMDRVVNGWKNLEQLFFNEVWTPSHLHSNKWESTDFINIVSTQDLEHDHYPASSAH